MQKYLANRQEISNQQNYGQRQIHRWINPVVNKWKDVQIDK